MLMSEYAKGLSDKKLIDELASMETLIEDFECFNVRDLVLRDYLEAEALDRNLISEGVE